MSGSLPKPGGTKVGRLVQQPADTSAGVGFVGKTRDEMQVDVMTLLPTSVAAVPTNVVTLGLQLAVDQGFGCKQDFLGCHPFIGLQIKDRVAVDFWHDDARAFEYWLDLAQEPAVSVLEHNLLTGHSAATCAADRGDVVGVDGR